MGNVSERLRRILPHTFLKSSLFWSSSATLDRATSRYTRPLDIVSVLAERHGQGGSTPQALYDPYPFLKLPEPRKVKTRFPPSGGPRGPAQPARVKKKFRPSGPCGTSGVGPGAVPGPRQHSTEDISRFLGQVQLCAGHSRLAYLQSRAFQRGCCSTTHKCNAFRPESGCASDTGRKRATRCTRKWGRIPRAGKSS